MNWYNFFLSVYGSVYSIHIFTTVINDNRNSNLYLFIFVFVILSIYITSLTLMDEIKKKIEIQVTYRLSLLSIRRCIKIRLNLNQSYKKAINLNVKIYIIGLIFMSRTLNKKKIYEKNTRCLCIDNNNLYLLLSRWFFNRTKIMFYLDYNLIVNVSSHRASLW